MTDVKLLPPRPLGSPLYLREEELKQGVDLLFFAARGLTAEGDDLLHAAGVGRAHARALYMIGRRPALSIADLLADLRVTKQSLNRVLKDLMVLGFVERKPGQDDRRKRLLRLTLKGQALDDALWEANRARVAKAFRDAGPEAVAGYRKVLSGLIEADARRKPGSENR